MVLSLAPHFPLLIVGATPTPSSGSVGNLTCMFVKTTVRKRGDKSYAYLSLVETERLDGRTVHRTLLRLGEVSELRESGQLDRIIAALSAHSEGRWIKADELWIDSDSHARRRR